MKPARQSSDALTVSAARLKRWCIEKALPQWKARAHLKDGSWVEHLKLDGTADLEAERRWRVLARQVYVYAKATSLNWYDGRATAEATYHRMKTTGFVHRVNAAGDVTNNMRDLYDHAFYLLAASSLYDLTQEQAYLEDANATLNWIETELRHPKGGWKESNHAKLADGRRQNPHMHLFEASLFLHNITSDPNHLRFAEEVIQLFDKCIFDKGMISEFFESDWTLAKAPLGQTTEPGHGMEWIWLLGQYEKATGISRLTQQNALYNRALTERGWFLNDEETKSGEVRRETKRLWVQTEVIKAHLAMSEQNVPGARGMASATIEALFPTYLTPDGLWNDQINACDTNIAKTIPVSTFYHIICMATEAERVALLSKTDE